MKKKQITIRLPEILLNEFDRHVDGLNFRNRAHGIEVILSDWLEKKSAENKGEQQSIFKIKPPKKKRAGGKKNASKTNK